jgi:hypothetical protein
MTDPNVTGDGQTVTIRIRISIRKRGGRKLVLAPDAHLMQGRCSWLFRLIF